MARRIKVQSIVKGDAPCPPTPPPAPNTAHDITPTDQPKAFPPPPPFMFPSPCCPHNTQVVDNIDVVSLTPEVLTVQKGTYQGKKAFYLSTIAEAGVQSDWAQNDSTQKDFIKNKPDIPAMIAVETERAIAGEAAATTEVVAGEHTSVTSQTAQDGHTIYTVNAEAEPQVQANWAQNDSNKVDFIKHKPGAFTGATEQANGTQGFVPAPSIEERTNFLCGNGTWATVPECTTQEMDAWLTEVDEEVNNG